MDYIPGQKWYYFIDNTSVQLLDLFGFSGIYVDFGRCLLHKEHGEATYKIRAIEKYSITIHVGWQFMDESNNGLEGVIAFIKEIERLKDTTRTAWTKEGRRESVAEHSWRLAMFAMALENYYKDVDFDRVIRICLVHDLGEAYGGDVSATIEVNPMDKFRKEEKALQRLIAPLSPNISSEFLNLWREYNEGKTKEAKIAKALDKIETIIQHNQGENPPDFDYEFNLQYGKKLSLEDPIIKYIREAVDNETKDRIKEMERV